MKKARVFLLITFILTGTLLFKAGMMVGASSSSRPGSSGDPLITQSYLEERLSEVSGSSYKKVLLSKGKKISFDTGSEAIMYSGSATVTGSKGLINLTSGQMFKSGNSLSLYNVYFSPDSTSGISSSSECILYVKGGYKII